MLFFKGRGVRGMVEFEYRIYERIIELIEKEIIKITH